MWLPQGGALKIENLQFTQYSIIMLLSPMPYLIIDIDLILSHCSKLHTHTQTDTQSCISH